MSTFGSYPKLPAGHRLRYKNTNSNSMRTVSFMTKPHVINNRWLWFVDGVGLATDEYTFKDGTFTFTKGVLYPTQTLEGVYLGDQGCIAHGLNRINRFSVRKEVVNVTRGQTDINVVNELPINVYQVDVFVGGLYQHLGSYSIVGPKTIRLGSPFLDSSGEVMVVSHSTPYDQDPAAFT